MHPNISGTRVLRALLVATMALSLAAAALAETPLPLAIAVRENSVAITNVTKGGEVLLVSCTRTSRNGKQHVDRMTRVLRDDDRDGIIQFAPDARIGLRSVWVAVDLASGAAGHAAREMVPLKTITLSAKALLKDQEGSVFGLDVALRRLFLVVVRPNSGAWLLIARDGAKEDDDGVFDNKLRLSFDEARSLHGTEAAPNKLKAGDVLVGIDPAHLNVFLGAIAK